MDTGDTMFREWDLYDRIGRSNYMRHREVSTALFEALRHRPGPLRVVDLGCGDGWMADQVLSGSHVAEYVGVDLSESALERLSRRPCPGDQPESVRRRLVSGDVSSEVRRLNDRGFDVVLAGYVLHHFPSDAKAQLLDDVVRMLDVGGWLLWTDLVRSEGESREGLIRRIADDIGANWSALGPDERTSAIEHMKAFDFPETGSWMTEQVERRGVGFVRWLYRDAFYGTLLFQKPA
jgi:ubiquinone/menaquinone biosynthesis C-methylase UbiE